MASVTNPADHRTRRAGSFDWCAAVRRHLSFSRLPDALMDELERAERERRIAEEEERWMALSSDSD